jgi:nicotinic acid mononucleotide adenylyltransferase
VAGKSLVEKYLNRIHTLEMEENLDKVSSTEVRRCVSEGRSIAELVPLEVAFFIQKHTLYRDFAED